MKNMSTIFVALIIGSIIIFAGIAFISEGKPVKAELPPKPQTVEATGMWGIGKALGSEMKVNIPNNFDIVNVTWKDGSLWVLLKSKIDGHHEFVEKSSWGMVESKVIFNK